MQTHEIYALLGTLHEKLKSQQPVAPMILDMEEAFGKESDSHDAVDQIVKTIADSENPEIPQLDPWQHHFLIHRIEYAMVVLGGIPGLGIRFPGDGPTRKVAIETALLQLWQRNGFEYYVLMQERMAANTNK